MALVVVVLVLQVMVQMLQEQQVVLADLVVEAVDLELLVALVAQEYFTFSTRSKLW
jgi:hypothetical protein